MRVASWLFVLCTALGAVGVFLPSVELQLGGKAVSKRTQLSLYTAASDRELVRRLVAAYHRSSKRQLGGDLVRTVAPRTAGRVKSVLADARDAMDTLDDVGDDDVRTAGTVFAVALWVLLGLDAVIALVVFSQLMQGSYRRGRMVVALIGAILVTAIAIALHAGCRVAVWEANDEVGGSALALAAGAWVIPLAALAALAAAIVLVARSGRAGAPAVRRAA